MSDSILQALRLPEQRVEQELRQELAIALYTQDILSFGKAREFAEMDKSDQGIKKSSLRQIFILFEIVFFKSQPKEQNLFNF
ncbi:MAG: UPF0175 family protein [Leptolyngbyaceae cyanobacterium RU_5_1]|nr:UPF0175 family protein [Leptolyngbyaceae cyanobacterium RU_5_1]